MTAALVFEMGKYRAVLPTDRWYAESHVWLLPAEQHYLVGLTSYAVRLLQDVYFLDWSIDPGTRVVQKQAIGEIESSKAVSNLYAPKNGIIHDFNPALMHDPSLINADPYHAGWLYRFETTEPLLTAEEYYQHLEKIWPETQRLLKGQYNEAED
ncbi:MAG: glycine cleavage system protein H [Planctomycetaceae bacterium]|nr:MAG: glycine cleavage system protein H [Planctomycetaceae bacterium]